MPKLRKWVAYRSIERPYTRISKFKKKSYIRVNPNLKITRFDMGEAGANFEYDIDLIPKVELQIRQEAMESARQTAVRTLEKHIGKTGFHFKIRVYPFHILRENPLAAGAGADRMSTGMKKSFGKTIGIAARVKDGQKIFTIRVNKQNVTHARAALKKASKKLPCSFSIQVNPSKKK